jgi:hypothetical protein
VHLVEGIFLIDSVLRSASYIVSRPGARLSRSTTACSLPSRHGTIFASGALKLVHWLWHGFISLGAKSPFKAALSGAIVVSGSDGSIAAISDYQLTHVGGL